MFSIGVQLLYNTLSVCRTARESAIGKHIWISFPFMSPQSTKYFPVPYSRSSLVIYFIHSRVRMSIPTSQFIPSPTPWEFLSESGCPLGKLLSSNHCVTVSGDGASLAMQWTFPLLTILSRGALKGDRRRIFREGVGSGETRTGSQKKADVGQQCNHRGEVQQEYDSVHPYVLETALCGMCQWKDGSRNHIIWL